MDVMDREASSKNASLPKAEPSKLSKTLLQSYGNWARWLAIIYLVVLLLLMIFEEKLIFLPMRHTADWIKPAVQVEDANFQAADGTRLHGWLLAHDNPRAVVLFAHGNAGNLSHRLPMILKLKEQHRVSIMVFDYRGYGYSEGTPNEQGILQDARAARAWLADRCNIAQTDIVLMGRSLGGGVMVDLAAKDGARGLILESCFSSLPDVAAYHYPWFPVRLLMRNRLDAAEKIADYHGPLLQSHGDADSIIPYRLGRRLFEAANEPKQWFKIPKGHHNDSQPRKYYQALEKFFDQLPTVSK